MMLEVCFVAVTVLAFSITFIVAVVEVLLPNRKHTPTQGYFGPLKSPGASAALQKH